MKSVLCSLAVTVKVSPLGVNVMNSEAILGYKPLSCFVKIMAEIKTFRHYQDSETDRTFLVGKSVRRTQDRCCVSMLWSGELATGS